MSLRVIPIDITSDTNYLEDANWDHEQYQWLASASNKPMSRTGNGFAWRGFLTPRESTSDARDGWLPQ